LIELMVVIGIMGIILTIAIPGMYRYLHPNVLQKAVDDVQEACRAAREMAVLRTSTAILTINLKAKTLSVSVGASAPRQVAPGSIEEFAGESHANETLSHSGSFRLSDKITIEGLGLNGLDYTDDESVQIHFYPKGTSDDFSMILLNTETGDRRNVWLDTVTGYADFEVDPRKFRVK